MNKIITLFFILTSYIGFSQSDKQIMDRQGQVSFFSYTSVEDIEAINNYALSVLDIEKGEIAVQMLMSAFTFKKTLMEEHFNESYIESDIYQKSKFSGKILNFDPSLTEKQTRIIKGEMELHGVTNEVEIKVDIVNTEGQYIINGEFEVGVKDYDIKVPPLLSGNIAKTIKVKFRFQYKPL